MTGEGVDEMNEGTNVHNPDLLLSAASQEEAAATLDGLGLTRLPGWQPSYEQMLADGSWEGHMYE